VEHYLDIQGVPRRYFFELLSHFTSSELELRKNYKSSVLQRDRYWVTLNSIGSNKTL